MKIKNITIGARLFIGFGIIMTLVALMGIAALNQSERLWKITENLYNHPLQVSKATRDIKSDINHSYSLIKDVVIDENLKPQDLVRIINHIHESETSTLKSFDLLYGRYLGPKSHIDSANASFNEWKVLCNGIIEYRLKANNKQVYLQYRDRNEKLRDKLLAQVQVIANFANKKAEYFYTNSIAEKKRIISSISIILISLFVFTMIISYLIFNSIRKPIKALAGVADQYRQGNFNTRSSYISTNEIGQLSASLNELAASVQQQSMLNASANEITQLLTRENKLQPFCTQMLDALKQRTQAQIAVIYLLNEEQTSFQPFEACGLDIRSFKTFSASISNPCTELANQRTIRVSTKQSDGLDCFTTLTSEFFPHETIAIPVFSDNKLVAVILLASAHSFDTEAVALLDKIHFIITERLHGVMAFEKITNISNTLDVQFRNLEEKTRELTLQSEELKEYNIELKMQKKEVDDANRYKSAFLSNMSHELRTPLNSIIALSGVLTRKLKNSLAEDEYKYLSIIEKNGRQLLSIINDILDLSRVESGKEEINISSFSISHLVDSIVESLDPIAAEKGLSITNAIPDDLPALMSDNTKCRHILQNIMSNALKFTEQGSIIISAKTTGSKLIITISDTGIGIEPEIIPLIFDEFKQADDKMSRQYGGTGLGLAIAKKYVLLLGGSIDVQSKPGIGSTFNISLPLKHAAYRETNKNEPEVENSNNSNEISAAEIPGSKATILLVEDSEPQVIQMKYMLTKEGYQVRTARNGKEALESIKISKPDAMILDLMMPEVDGFQVIDSIRSQPETSQIPVLILTAKHITKNELYFLKGNHIHQIIFKGVVNRTELLGHVSNMVNSINQASVNKTKDYSLKLEQAHILVIEDNQDNLYTVNALLSGKCNISGTTSLTEGLILAREHKPDLILLDVSLPVQDGFTVLNEIRMDENLKHLPVIALTARAMKGDREELLSSGFDGYISKPIEFEIMEQTIITALQNHAADLRTETES